MTELIDLDLLRCPHTRSRLKRDGDWLVAETGGRRYPIRDGIAVLLPEAASSTETSADAPLQSDGATNRSHDSDVEATGRPLQRP